MTRTKNNLKDFIIIDKEIILDNNEKCFVVMEKESRKLYLATRQDNFIISKDEDKMDRLVWITDKDIEIAKEITEITRTYLESLAVIIGSQYSLAQNKIDIVLTKGNKEKVYRIARESTSCNNGLAEKMGIELYTLPSNMTKNNEVLYELLYHIFPQIVGEYNLSKEQEKQLEITERKLLQKFQQVNPCIAE